MDAFRLQNRLIMLIIHLLRFQFFLNSREFALIMILKHGRASCGLEVKEAIGIGLEGHRVEDGLHTIHVFITFSSLLFLGIGIQLA